MSNGNTTVSLTLKLRGQQAKQVLEQMNKAQERSATELLKTNRYLEGVLRQQAQQTGIQARQYQQMNKQVRKDIQAAINAEREITQEQTKQSNIDPALQVAQYKTLANDVHEQIQALIETRPPIRNTPILLNCTTHWLAHQLYGDMNRAEEIKHLNPTVNFAVLRSGMELITYAR